MNDLNPALDLLRKQLDEYDRLIQTWQQRADAAKEEHKIYSERVEAARSQRASLSDAVQILEDEVAS